MEYVFTDFKKGYSQTHSNQLITVFSAPNYCYRCGNLGGLIDVDEQNGLF